MIIVIGLDSDPTVQHFVQRTRDTGIKVRTINLRELVLHGAWWIPHLPNEPVRLYINREEVVLNPEDSYYCRLINLGDALSGDQAKLWTALMYGLHGWLTQIPGTVVNRPGHHAHNAYKAFHSVWLARYGLRFPPTIYTTDVDVLHRFVAAGPTVSKAISGERVNTAVTLKSDLDRYDPDSGPISLQRQIFGDDLRVHVVGDTLFPERISSSEVDYRTADAVTFEDVVELPPNLRQTIVKATKDMGLIFCGWDFKIDAQGQYWCLEANPMPGYDSYDRRKGGLITQSLVQVLTSN